MNIEIWIPAHNEEKVISQTIEGLKSCQSENTNFKIGVACNGCQDNTENLAKSAGAQVLSLPAIGKWRTIVQIVEQSQADWIGFIDAGTILEPKLLATSLGISLKQMDLVGFTVEYLPASMNMIESVYWSIESRMKSIEEKMGGLVIVSGFAMFFHRAELAEALVFLKKEFGDIAWLNDDVILPLSIRFLFPQKKIKLYTSSAEEKQNIVDLGLKKLGGDHRRRLRMMRGNLQWMRRMLPLFFDARFISLQRMIVLLLISRKTLKVFWSYFALLLLFLLAFEFSAVFLLLPVIGFVIPKIRHVLIGAFFASLRAPFELMTRESSEITW